MTKKEKKQSNRKRMNAGRKKFKWTFIVAKLCNLSRHYDPNQTSFKQILLAVNISVCVLRHLVFCDCVLIVFPQSFLPSCGSAPVPPTHLILLFLQVFVIICH